jgi:hypothetical protein
MVGDGGDRRQRTCSFDYLVSCVHVTALSGQHHTQRTIRLWRYGGIISLADMGVLGKGKIPHKAPIFLHIEGQMSAYLRVQFCEASEIDFLAYALLLFNDNQA